MLARVNHRTPACSTRRDRALARSRRRWADGSGVADPVGAQDAVEDLRDQAAELYRSRPRMSSTSLAPMAVPTAISIGSAFRASCAGGRGMPVDDAAVARTAAAKSVVRIFEIPYGSTASRSRRVAAPIG